MPKRPYPEGWDKGFKTDFRVSDPSDLRRICVMYHTRASTGSVNAVRRNRKIQRALTKLYAAINPSGYTILNEDAPLSGACRVLWGPTGTPWGRAEGCTM